MGVSPARTAAFDVLEAVEGGGYASDLLRWRTAALDSRDAGLASELVFGVLRYRGQLDFLIAHYSGREAGKLDREVRRALQLGIYQIRYLERVPRHAAVSESVELVRRARKGSATGFVNAVLRKVDRRAVDWPDREVELSHPEWLLARWEGRFGADGARRIARAFLEPPVTYVRAPEGQGALGAKLAATPVAGCFRLVSGDSGGLRRQDISSQAIVPLLELAPGQSLLDLCAAPGNKTAQALETDIRAVAADVSRRRLAELRGLNAALVNLDGTRPLPFCGEFDRILVDAPCSGTGTIGRNPEIKWRIGPADLDRHHERQARLLGHALPKLAAGGRLVYSTCSLEDEENRAVIEEALAEAPPSFTVEEELQRIPGRDSGDGFYAAVIGKQ